VQGVLGWNQIKVPPGVEGSLANVQWSIKIKC
jgi:hypothetical protein